MENNETIYKKISLASLMNEMRFRKADTYRKKANVYARKVLAPEKVVTVLANSTMETERIAQPGEWIIINPGGERYGVSDEKFKSRYELLTPDVIQDSEFYNNGAKIEEYPNGFYHAKGVIKAFRNYYGVPVSIDAPWGSEQFGDADCWFAVALDAAGEITADRYIIGGQEFADTYQAF